MNSDNPQNIIEQEFRFLIPYQKLQIDPPTEILSFKMVESSVIKIEDSLFERKGITLKEENIGFRVRKINDDKIEFTYKKFLGRENNIVRYDEFTLDLNEPESQDLKSNVFTNPRLPILTEMQEKGNLYYFVTVANKRKVYNYKDNNSLIELVIEDIVYSDGKNEAKDSAIEIEIKADNSNKENVYKFVDKIKEIYKCEDLNEGKNARAMRLLNITLQ